MTGPDEPHDELPEWDFPELAAPDPSSIALPESGVEPVYDTGSDGWWRAQARAQREAADSEPPLFRAMPPVVPVQPVQPADLIEPTVLNDPAYLPSGPSPLDDAYLPPEQVFPPLAAEPPVPVEPPVPEEPPSPPRPPAPQPQLMRPLVVPDPDQDWYDAPPATHQLDEDEGGGWRRSLAWAALAVAGVGLLVVAFLLLGKGEPKGTPTVAAPAATTAATATASPTPSLSPTPSAQPTPTLSSAPPVALAPIVPVTVLNNSKIHHLAQRAAARFRAGGWPVPATGNYRGKLETSTVFYPAGERASALRFAKQFGVRVLPRPAGLPGSGMTVVVTRDFA